MHLNRYNSDVWLRCLFLSLIVSTGPMACSDDVVVDDTNDAGYRMPPTMTNQPMGAPPWQDSANQQSAGPTQTPSQVPMGTTPGQMPNSSPNPNSDPSAANDPMMQTDQMDEQLLAGMMDNSSDPPMPTNDIGGTPSMQMAGMPNDQMAGTPDNQMRGMSSDDMAGAPMDDSPVNCTPDCDAAMCGPDGCGGQCGPECPNGQPCVDGQCEGPQPWLNFPSPVGYGRNATGGRDGRVCQVTNLNDSGEGSLRSCVLGNEAKWVIFAVDGTINLQSEVRVGSHTTIDGRGRNIKLTNRGLELSRVQNVIVHGIRIEDGDRGDAIRIVNESRDIWIDHVTLKNFDDGLIDITRESTAVTVSWCHFKDHRKVMLLGSDPDQDGDRVMRVTIHHNWFERTNSRHPRARYGRVHIYNNYFDRWGHYAVGISQRAQAYIEHNVFRADDSEDGIITRVGEDPKKGKICTTHNRHINGSEEAEEHCDGFWRPDYPYTHDDDMGELTDIVKNGAGAP